MKFVSSRVAVGRALLIANLAAVSSMLSLAASADTSLTPVSGFTHQTAPTQFIDVDGTRIAYRRFGKQTSVPLVFFQHFAGNMDNWDPKVTDSLARDREVILFDNAGVASSEGEVPTRIEDMAKRAIGLIHALGIKKADLLGFSMGSFVAQEVTVEQPDLVRRLILLGSSPRGGVGMATLTPEFKAQLAKKHDVPDELLLDTLFTPSSASQAAGHEFLTRLRARKVNRDSDASDQVAPAQTAAIAAWGAPHEDSNAYLKKIRQPVLVVDGSNDIVFYTINSFNLQQNLPNAQLIVYPDANHGAQYQYPDLFVKHVNLFLNAVK